MIRANGHYRTMDSYVAGYLALKGFQYNILKDAPNKYVFIFVASPNLYEELTNYNNGALVEASRLAGKIKLLKGELFSVRREEELQGWSKNR